MSKVSREKQIQIIINKVVQSLQKGRAEREAAIPKVPLESKHMDQCELLLNRREMLERLPKKSLMAEIGVDEGVFSRQIHEIVQPEIMHLVDVWGSDRFHNGKFEDVKRHFNEQIAEGSVQIHKKLSTDAVHDFNEGYFDWIYIDTDHSYETTRDELRLYASKVKKDGIIAGHDYVKGNWITSYRYGVIEAVHEFCVQYNWQLIYLTAEPLENQSFAIQRILE